MKTFKKHPVDVIKRSSRFSRVHALEVARRAMEKGAEGSMMPLLANEMPNPLAQAQAPQDPTAMWPGAISALQGRGAPPEETPPGGGMM